jgi:hypothetical protein
MTGRRNAERDLQRWVSRQPWRRLLPGLYTFEMPKRRRLVVAPATHWALLPHEVFASLAAGAA